MAQDFLIATPKALTIGPVGQSLLLCKFSGKIRMRAKQAIYKTKTITHGAYISQRGSHLVHNSLQVLRILH